MFTHQADWLAPASTQHPEALPQPPPEVAQDDQPDALGVLGHPGGVAGLPLDPRVCEPAGRDLGGDHAVGRAAAAVLDVDQHRVVAPPSPAGPITSKSERPRLLGVEPDDAVGRRRPCPTAVPQTRSQPSGLDGLAAGDGDPESRCLHASCSARHSDEVAGRFRVQPFTARSGRIRMSDTIAHASAGRYVGQAVLRKEDPRLLTGRGRYNDDVTLPGMLHAHFVRSDVARAKFRVDVSAARDAAGVVAVFTAADLNDKVADTMYPSMFVGAEEFMSPMYPLAVDDVRFVGDPIALIIARAGISPKTPPSWSRSTTTTSPTRSWTTTPPWPATATTSTRTVPATS